MLALKGLTPSGQLPLGVLSEGRSGLNTGIYYVWLLVARYMIVTKLNALLIVWQMCA